MNKRAGVDLELTTFAIDLEVELEGFNDGIGVVNGRGIAKRREGREGRRRRRRRRKMDRGLT